MCHEEDKAAKYRMPEGMEKILRESGDTDQGCQLGRTPGAGPETCMRRKYQS